MEAKLSLEVGFRTIPPEKDGEEEIIEPIYKNADYVFNANSVDSQYRYKMKGKEWIRLCFANGDEQIIVYDLGIWNALKDKIMLKSL